MRKLLAALVVVAGLLAVAPLTSAPVPKSIKGSGTIFIWTNGRTPALDLYSPDGEHIRGVNFGKDTIDGIEDISPDGKQVVVTISDPAGEQTLYLLEMDRSYKRLPDAVICGWHPKLVWSHDGKTVFASVFTQETLNAPKKGEVYETEVVKIDLTTEKKMRLEVGSGHQVVAVSPDGNELVTRVLRETNSEAHCSQYVVTVDQKGSLPTLDTDDCGWKWASRFECQSWPCAGGCPIDVKVPIANSKVQDLHWPAKLKGKAPGEWCLNPRCDKVLLSWQEEYKLPAKWAEYGPRYIHKLGVCDFDGTNLRVIYTQNPEVPGGFRFDQVHFAWR